MDDNEQRVREWAYRLWQEEGCPEGRDTIHWDKARELVATEDNQRSTTIPVRTLGPQGEPVEEAKIQNNYGEFPTLTDQDEGRHPHWPP